LGTTKLSVIVSPVTGTLRVIVSMSDAEMVNCMLAGLLCTLTEERAAAFSPAMAIVTFDVPPEETEPLPLPPPHPSIIAVTRNIKITAIDLFIFFIVTFPPMETLSLQIFVTVNFMNPDVVEHAAAPQDVTEKLSVIVNDDDEGSHCE
jgi:hypothetical protein